MTVKEWNWLRVFAVSQAAFVLFMYLFRDASVETSTFFLVMAVFIWMIGAKS